MPRLPSRKHLLWALPLLAAAVAALAWYQPWPTRDLTHLPALERINTRVRLSGDERAQLAESVRGVLRGEIPAETPSFKGRTMVFVSLFHAGMDPLFVRSEIDDFPAAWGAVLDRLKSDPRHAEFAAVADDTSVKIDVLRSLRPLKRKSSARRLDFETGLHGLILQKKNELVVQPPWDILTGDWDVMEGEGRFRRRMEKQMRLLSEQAGRGRWGWQNANLYKFRTVEFIQDRSGAGTRDLYRGLVPHKGFPARDEVDHAVREAVRWIQVNTSDKGKFTYLYYPIDDDQNLSFNYGVVRHAAAVYGLYAAYNALGDDSFYQTAERTLDYMKGLTRAPLFAPETMSVRQNGLSLLGATALGLLSLIEKPRDRVTPEEADLARRMADFILIMQMGDGSYYASYEQKLVGYHPSAQVPYFPGESFLALVRYYQWTNDHKYLDAALLAANYQVAEFDRTGLPDAWCIQALSILAGIDTDPRWPDACLRMAEYHLRHQHTRPDSRHDIYRDYVGGFDNSRPPRATPAGSRTEALSAAWELAARIGDPREKAIGDAVLMATRFIMNNQYGPEINYLVRNPERAGGGIRGGLVDNTVRVDFNQHCIVAMLGALRVIDHRAQTAPLNGLPVSQGGP